jgi:hypothetical protein
MITYMLGAALALILISSCIIAYRMVTSPWGVLALMALLAVRFGYLTVHRKRDTKKVAPVLDKQKALAHAGNRSERRSLKTREKTKWLASVR